MDRNYYLILKIIIIIKDYKDGIILNMNMVENQIMKKCCYKFNSIMS